jgi:hypothetical protein
MQRALIVIVVCALVSGFATHARSARSEEGITPAIRANAANLVNVAPQDRAWIQASIASARPEARRLIDEVDGLIDFRTDLNQPGSSYPIVQQAIGLTDYSGGRAVIALDAGRLDGDRAIDRPMVVLHELGHVIDFLLVDDAMVARLDAGIPPAGACMGATPEYGSCTAVPERFADTFAKWALRGRFSLAGSGYGIPTPPSLEDWGRPLAQLAYQLDTK